MPDLFWTRLKVTKLFLRAFRGGGFGKSTFYWRSARQYGNSCFLCLRRCVPTRATTQSQCPKFPTETFYHSFKRQWSRTLPPPTRGQTETGGELIYSGDFRNLRVTQSWAIHTDIQGVYEFLQFLNFGPRLLTYHGRGGSSDDFPRRPSLLPVILLAMRQAGHVSAGS